MFLRVFQQQELWDGGITIRVRFLHPEVLDPLSADPQFEAFLRKINRAWGLEPDGSLPESDTERAGREGAPTTEGA